MIGAGYWGLRRHAAPTTTWSLDGDWAFHVYWLFGCSVLGGASTIGGVALGYDYGISGMWLVFWIGMGVIALGILMSSRPQQTRCTPSRRCWRTATGRPRV